MDQVYAVRRVFLQTQPRWSNTVPTHLCCCCVQGDTYIFALTVDSDVYVWGGAGRAPLGLPHQEETYEPQVGRKGSTFSAGRCVVVVVTYWLV